jgi:hypothetical protein
MSAIRRLAVVDDVVGYSHLIEANEAGTLRKRFKPSSEDGPSRHFVAAQHFGRSRCKAEIS